MIEGPTLVVEALAAGLVLQEAFATADADAEVRAALIAADVPVHEVRPEVLARSVDTVTPQGLAVVAERFEVPLADAVAAAAAGPLTLVLLDVADPGNAGTLVRTAEAAGAAAVLFCGRSVDPSNPKCVRSSAGALFHRPVASGGDIMGALDLLRTAGVRTAATVVRGGRPYHQVDLRGPVALVLGSEAHGLPAEVVAAVDEPLTIPMAGRSESLNVAMAGAVVAFEALRQRQAGGA